jgi:hypothetical protein
MRARADTLALSLGFVATPVKIEFSESSLMAIARRKPAPGRVHHSD